MDTAIGKLAALRRVALDSEDAAALQEVLGEVTEMRRRVDS